MSCRLNFKIGDRVLIKLSEKDPGVLGTITKEFPFHKKYYVEADDGDEYIIREEFLHAAR